MAEEKQPDAEVILDLKRQLEDAWSNAHAQWETIDDFVQGRNQVWDLPEDRATRTSKRSNQARVIIDHTSDNLLPYKPVWHRDPIGKREDSQDKADIVEEWIDALWTDASMDQAFIPTKAAARNFLKYNYAILEVGFSPEEMPEEPDKDDPNFINKQRDFDERTWNCNPFSLRAPHPSQVLLPPPLYERTPAFAIKTTRWYRLDFERMIKAKKDADAENLVKIEEYDAENRAFDEIEVVEYFSPEWHAFVMQEGNASGTIQLLERNLPGIVPFVHAFGGFGDVPSGIDGDDPQYMAQGFLWPALDLIQLLDQVISAKAELEMKAAFAPMLAPEDLIERIAQLLQAGSNMIPGDVRTVGYMPVQQLPQYLADFQDRIERAIVMATISSVAFGERPVGVDTVGQHAMMLQVSFKRMLETMEQMAFMVAETASMWMKTLASWDEPITIRGKKLSPQDMQQNYHILAHFPLSDEAVKMQRTQQGADLVSRGLKSRRRHWEEDQGVTNISEEEDQILREQVMADPILTSALAEKKRRELGIQELYEEQQQRMAAERTEGFARTQAEAGLPGFTPPQSEEEMAVQAAEQQVMIRPPAAQPGTGQMQAPGG
jgi:hypothetical protein